ncbi:MAG TPA: acyl-CoA dehydrogenase family protein [Myxococcota bacterium]
MDFEPDAEQLAILEAVGALLAQHAGAKRAIELNRSSEYDGALDAALEAAGFQGVALAEGTGLLEAALVVEAVAKAGGVVGIGASALVAPGLAGRALPGPIALAKDGEAGPVRFAAHARSLLVDAGEEALLRPLGAGDATPVASNFMLPMGRVRAWQDRGRSLGRGSGERLRSLWRLALAAETLGTMAACLEVTLEYVKRRRQFGRAIGSFQAVQHRLAHCAVLLEGSRWLVYEAASQDAPADACATAAAFATSAAGLLFAETHQFTGAMGFTREHDLHVWSMRLQVLRLEAGGVAGHRRAVARERWCREP